MGSPFISVRGRVILNVEALNMTESVGNYVKHRRVPVVISKGGEYLTLFVPAISGESVAHGYQALLAKAAESRGLSVCDLCSKGIFLKSSNEKVLKKSFQKHFSKQGIKATDIKTPYDLEKFIITGCVVEDVGGFLYAPAGGGKKEIKVSQAKRTSNFYTGYMIPVAEALENAVIEPQLHSRYALGTEFVERGEGGERAQGQMIYYVEVASAPYVFSFDLDTKYIGRITFDSAHAGELVVKESERKERIAAALEALKKLILELGFGAKKTRFLPTIEWESLAIAVSNDVWTVPTPFTADYIERARKKMEAVSEGTKLYTYTREGNKALEEVLEEAIKDALNRLDKS